MYTGAAPTRRKLVISAHAISADVATSRVAAGIAGGASDTEGGPE
jgi:hypothetical protein